MNKLAPYTGLVLRWKQRNVGYHIPRINCLYHPSPSVLSRAFKLMLSLSTTRPRVKKRRADRTESDRQSANSRGQVDRLHRSHKKAALRSAVQLEATQLTVFLSPLFRLTTPPCSSFPLLFPSERSRTTLFSFSHHAVTRHVFTPPCCLLPGIVSYAYIF